MPFLLTTYKWTLEHNCRLQLIAPHTGAWIETFSLPSRRRGRIYRSSHRSVDWNCYDDGGRWYSCNRSSHRSVDWNKFNRIPAPLKFHRSSHRSVDWNILKINQCIDSRHRSSHRSVDWNAECVADADSAIHRSSHRSVDWNDEPLKFLPWICLSLLTQERGLKPW